MTVIDLFKKRSMQNANVKQGTVVNRSNLIKLLENDAFGAMPIEKVKMSDAKEWVIRMRAKGYAYSSLKNHKRSLSAAFHMAVENDYIRKNPFHFEIEDLIEDDTIPPPEGLRFGKQIHKEFQKIAVTLLTYYPQTKEEDRHFCLSSCYFVPLCSEPAEEPDTI